MQDVIYGDSQAESLPCPCPCPGGMFVGALSVRADHWGSWLPPIPSYLSPVGWAASVCLPVPVRAFPALSAVGCGQAEGSECGRSALLNDPILPSPSLGASKRRSPRTRRPPSPSLVPEAARNLPPPPEVSGGGPGPGQLLVLPPSTLSNCYPGSQHLI